MARSGALDTSVRDGCTFEASAEFELSLILDKVGGLWLQLMRWTGCHNDLGGGGGRGGHVILCLVNCAGGDEAEEAPGGGSGDHWRRRTNRRDLQDGRRREFKLELLRFAKGFH